MLDAKACEDVLGSYCGHNLPPLDFDPLKKNVTGTPLNFKICIAISYISMIPLLDT